jgi:hypothetical protein
MESLAKSVNGIRKTCANAWFIWSSALVILLAGSIGLPGAALQASGTPNNAAELHPFVGIWNATFKGKVFETIKLEDQQGKLVGTVRGATIQLDNNGELTSAHAIDSNDPFPILEAKLVSGVLRITTKEKDSEEPIQFEMRLTGADEGELRLLAPPEVTAPKPWKLQRAKTEKSL